MVERPLHLYIFNHVKINLMNKQPLWICKMQFILTHVQMTIWVSNTHYLSNLLIVGNILRKYSSFLINYQVDALYHELVDIHVLSLLINPSHGWLYTYKSLKFGPLMVFSSQYQLIMWTSHKGLEWYKMYT